MTMIHPTSIDTEFSPSVVRCNPGKLLREGAAVGGGTGGDGGGGVGGLGGGLGGPGGGGLGGPGGGGGVGGGASHGCSPTHAAHVSM